MRNVIYKFRLMLLGIFIAIGANAIAQIGGGAGISGRLPTDPTFASLTVQDDVNTSLTLTADNDSNGTANASRTSWSSGDANVALFAAGSGRTSTLVTNGPTGAQAVLRTLGNYPLVFGTSNTERMRIAGDGTATFSNSLFVTATAPLLYLSESDATADNGLWRFQANAEQFRLLTRNDADGGGADVFTVDRTGTTVDTINLVPTTIQHNGTEATHDTGSYTGTVTGCTTSPTVTVRYERAGNIATIFVPLAQCTSNATTFSITGAPASIRPNDEATGQWPVFGCTNNTVNNFSGCGADMGTNGTMNFYLNSSGANSWTSSGTKGLSTDFEATYSLHP